MNIQNFITVFAMLALTVGCAAEIDPTQETETSNTATAAAQSLSGPVKVNLTWGYFGEKGKAENRRWNGLLFSDGASMRVTGREQLEDGDTAELMKDNNAVQWATKTYGDSDGMQVLVEPKGGAARVTLALTVSGMADRRIDLGSMDCDALEYTFADGHKLFIQRECTPIPTSAPELEVQIVWGAFAGGKAAPASWNATITATPGAALDYAQDLQLESKDRITQENESLQVVSTTEGDVDGVQVILTAPDWSAAPFTTLCFNAAGTSACVAMKDLVCGSSYTEVSATNGVYMKGSCPSQTITDAFSGKADYPSPGKGKPADQDHAGQPDM
jgi:hypothetical protein